jgi:AAA family ATP:ADP antiporter
MTRSNSRSLLRAVQDVRREELPLALLMLCYFFLVISTFWILKPIKKALFVEFYRVHGFQLLGLELSGSQAELLAKVLNMAVAYAAVVIFSLLARRLRRQGLSLVCCAFFTATFGLYVPLLSAPGALVVWSFYLFGDLYSTLMVATFFAFLNDSFAPGAARRVYGLVVLGGVAGGVFGTGALRLFIHALDNGAWLIVCIGITLAVSVLAFFAGRIVGRNPPADQSAPAAAPTSWSGNPALQGARLALRSRYLLSVVAIVGLYEIVSTVMDFQFTSTLEHYANRGEIVFKEHLTTISWITNSTSLLVQLLLTGFIMTRFRLTVALLLLPVAALTGSGAFMVLPLLWIGSLLNTVDNSLSYSVNQSSKEALYTVTTREEKYQAKAFIDMFVQRFAKALAVAVSLAVTLVFSDFGTIRWLSLFTAGVVALWMVAARYAGRRFHQLADRGSAAVYPGGAAS